MVQNGYVQIFEQKVYARVRAPLNGPYQPRDTPYRPELCFTMPNRSEVPQNFRLIHASNL